MFLLADRSCIFLSFYFQIEQYFCLPDFSEAILLVITCSSFCFLITMTKVNVNQLKPCCMKLGKPSLLTTVYLSNIFFKQCIFIRFEKQNQSLDRSISLYWLIEVHFIFHCLVYLLFHCTHFVTHWFILSWMVFLIFVQSEFYRTGFYCDCI